MDRAKSKISRIGWSVAVLFLAACVLWVPDLRAASRYERSLYDVGGSDAALSHRNASAFAQILGEIRTTAADLLFMKTNRYLHAGIGYAPVEKADLMGKEKLDAVCASGTPTQIRARKDDFRGFLGDLERTVKPYRDASQAHTHTQMTELIPWYRIMTLSNPRYIRGYRVGGMTLVDTGRWQAALDFMNEGLRNNRDNPELFLLYQTLTQFHTRGKYQKTYPWGEAWSQNALDAAMQGFELGKTERPEFGREGKIRNHLVWSDDLEEDFLFCASMAALLLREQGKLDDALRYVKETNELAPNFLPIRRLIETLRKQISEKKGISNRTPQTRP